MGEKKENGLRGQKAETGLLSGARPEVQVGLPTGLRREGVEKWHGGVSGCWYPGQWVQPVAIVFLNSRVMRGDLRSGEGFCSYLPYLLLTHWSEQCRLLVSTWYRTSLLSSSFTIKHTHTHT